jgi:integrase
MPRTPKLSQKNGYWYTRAGDPNGVYFGKVGDVPYSAARKLFGKHLESLEETRRAAAGGVSVLALCEQFLDWVEAHRSPRTYDERKRHLDRFCNFRCGMDLIADREAQSLQARDLQVFLAHVRAAHNLDEFTTDKHATSVKAAFHWATKHPSPTPLLPPVFRPFASLEKYKRPASALSEHDLLTTAEIAALLRCADADLAAVVENRKLRRRRPDEYRPPDENPYVGFRDLLSVYWHTGARTSELAACRVRDWVRSSHQLVLGSHKRARTMKDPAARRITLNAEAVDIVSRHAAGKPPEALVFQDPKGRPWTRYTLDQRFAAVRERAGVRDEVTIYSFRHTWISEALMSGIDAATVARMAGTSIAMIEKVYGHFSTQHLLDAQNRLDALRQSKTPIAGATPGSP